MGVQVVPQQIEIEPASLTQVLDGYDGTFYEITDDTVNVARDLRAIDPSLHLRYSRRGRHYVVYQLIELDDGGRKEHLVTTALECDQRLVRRVREITHPSYDLAADLDRVEREGRAARDNALVRGLHENGDRLAHAARQGFGLKDRIFVP